jgi:hypothetical protein
LHGNTKNVSLFCKKKMKKIYLTLLTVVWFSGVYSQEISPVHFGPMVGGTLSFPGSESEKAQTTNQQQPGFLAGAFVRIKLGSYFLQPELYYNASSFGVTLNPNPPLFGPALPPTDLKGSIRSLDMPLILGRYFLNVEDFKIRINAGPVASLRVSDFFEKPKGGDFDYNTDSQSFIWSLAVGAGVDISRFTIDARYHYQFGRPISTPELKVRYDMLTLTVGYKLF